MSESSKRKPGSSVVDPRKGKGETPLRLVTPENSIDFSPPPDAGDDSPTIISKARPKAPTDAPSASPPTDSLMADLRGRKLAHFELLEPIGVGGMAAVLRARDSQLDRIVALKILPPEMAQDPENVRRFHQEARAAAKLDHENIARVFFCGEDQNLHFIAFEYVQGDNLRTLLERRGRLPIDEAIGYVLQIAAGLEHAHGRGVIHRDVKPSNIIITPSGRAKLVDMGLARNLEKVDDQQLTQSGVTLGTFDYISPEQALEPRDADGRSDMYSLGCTVYHMLTGQPPTPEGTAAKKLHHHQNLAPIDPRLLNPEVTDEVALILGKMMAKDPRDRYQRPVELVQHLMHVAQKLGVGGAIPEGGFLVEAPLPSEPRFSTAWMIGIGMGALAAILLVLSLAPPAPQPSDPRPANISPKTTQTPITTVTPKVAPTPNLPGNDFAEQLRTKNGYKGKGTVKLGDGIVIPRGDGERKIVIENNNDFDKLTLRYEHAGKSPTDGANAGELAAGLLFEDCDVTFRDLQIEIKSNTPHSPVAAIALRGRGTLRFEKCVFSSDVSDRALIPRGSDSAKAPRVPVAAVLADSGGDGNARPKLVFEQCAFLHGQVAVASQGAADVTMTDCTFRPQHAFVHLRGPGESTVRMENCSGFVVNGPAFRLDGESKCKLTLTNNIFSRPEIAYRSDSVKDQTDQPDLIRQIDASTPHVVLDSSRNLFHNLNALWVMRTASKASDRLIVGLEEFRREVQQAEGMDAGSVATNVSPWLAKEPLKDEQTNDAFRLNEKFKGLQPAEFKLALGVRIGPWARMPLRGLDEPMPDYVPQLLSNQKVVGPDETIVAGKVFRLLDEALQYAKAGDEILLKPGKAGSEFKLEAEREQNKKLRLTLKPWKGTKPVLSMSVSAWKDAAMFWIGDGAELNCDGIEFRLEPELNGHTGFAVAQFQGTGAANFSNCVFTLQHRKEKGANVPLAVVLLAESNKAMMMNVPPTTATPSASFTNCFIRGDGDAVVARQSTPLELKFERSLVMISGSLLSVQSVGKDSGRTDPIKLECSRSAFFHGDALIVAKGDRTAKGYHPIRGRAFDDSESPGISDCWFVPLSLEAPLVRLETSESLDDLNLRSMFSWIANRNVYGSYDRMLEQKSEGDLFRYRMTPMRWKEMFHRGDALIPSKAFLQPSIRTLAAALPKMARPREESLEEIGDTGPILDELPLPAERAEKTDE